MIVEKLKAKYAATPADRDPSKIGISSIGHCSRQLAYRKHKVQGIPIGWRSQVIFDDGRLHHDAVRAAIRGLDLSPYTFGGEEAKVSIRTPKGHEIVGHVDGYIFDDDGPAMLFEFKSMSVYGFKDFLAGKIDDSYLAQASGYMLGSGLEDALFLAKNKNTSDMAEMLVKRDDALLNKRLIVLDSVLDSKRPEDVPREYGPKKGDKGELQWQCGYCPFWKICWEKRNPKEVDEHKVVIE